MAPNGRMKLFWKLALPGLAASNHFPYSITPLATGFSILFPGNPRTLAPTRLCVRAIAAQSIGTVAVTDILFTIRISGTIIMTRPCSDVAMESATKTGTETEK